MGDHMSMGTEFDGDRLPRGDQFYGDRLSRGINFMGIFCPGGGPEDRGSNGFWDAPLTPTGSAGPVCCDGFKRREFTYWGGLYASFAHALIFEVSVASLWMDNENVIR